MIEFKGDKRTKEYKDWKAKQSKGLGDTIEKITEVTGIKKAVEVFSRFTGMDCGCDERKAKLNKKFPYKVECLREDEYNYLKTFFSEVKGTVNVEQQNRLIRINNRVFNDNRQGSSCGSCVREMVNNLKLLYNDYNN